MIRRIKEINSVSRLEEIRGRFETTLRSAKLESSKEYAGEMISQLNERINQLKNK